MLDAALGYYSGLGGSERATFRFVHVSTDEVFGSLGEDGAFNEETPYDPSSPYSASKAGADHLARAWQRTFGLPVIVTNCSNNYGPYQFPEKLIPLMTLRASQGETLPSTAKETMCAIGFMSKIMRTRWRLVAERGQAGETYCISGQAERRNIDVARSICDLVDRKLACVRSAFAKA